MTDSYAARKRLKLIFDVADDAQAAELSSAWEEIIAGKRTWLRSAAQDRTRSGSAMMGLKVIVRAFKPIRGRARPAVW